MLVYQGITNKEGGKRLPVIGYLLLVIRKGKGIIRILVIGDQEDNGERDNPLLGIGYQGDIREHPLVYHVLLQYFRETYTHSPHSRFSHPAV